MKDIIFWRVCSIFLLAMQAWAMYADKSSEVVMTLMVGMFVTAIGADILQAIKEKKV